MCGAGKEIHPLRAIGAVRRPRLEDDAASAEEAAGFDAVVELSFRGAANPAEWVPNSTNLEKTRVGLREGSTHKALQSGYIALRDRVRFEVGQGLARLRAEPARTLVIISGHGLGGGLALLAAYDWACRSEGYNVRSITWACVPAGDAEFAEAFNLRVTASARFINRHDPVPMLAPEPKDEHGHGLRMQLAKKVVGYSNRATGALDIVKNTAAALDSMSGSDIGKTKLDAATRAIDGDGFRATFCGGLVHACCAAVLDEKSSGSAKSMRRKLAFVQDAAMAAMSRKLGKVKSLGKQILEHHSAEDYARTLEEAIEHRAKELRKEASRVSDESSFQLLPSVATWYLPVPSDMREDEDDASKEDMNRSRSSVQVVGHLCSNSPIEMQGFMELGRSLLRALEEKNGADVMLDVQDFEELVRSLDVDVTDAGQARLVDILEALPTQDGLDDGSEDELAQLSSQAKEKMLVMLPALMHTAKETGVPVSDPILQELMESSTAGKQLIEWGREQAQLIKDDPSRLLKFNLADVMSGAADCVGEDSASLLDAWQTILDRAKDECVELGLRPSTLLLLRKYNCIDSAGSAMWSQVLSHSKDFAETDEGTALLQYAQSYVSKGLQAVRDTARENEDLQDVRGIIESTEAGRKIVRGVKAFSTKIEDDPDVFKDLVSGMDLKEGASGAVKKRVKKALADQYENFLDSIKKELLEFLKEKMPTLEIPVIEDEQDGWSYHVSNITLSVLDITKRCNIQVMRVPGEASLLDMTSSTALPLDSMPVPHVSEKSGENTVMDAVGMKFGDIIKVCATDFDVRIPGLRWKFAQTNFRFGLKGHGEASADVRGFCLEVAFVVAKEEIDGRLRAELKLHSSRINFDTFDIKISESRMSSMYNWIVKIFNNKIKDCIIENANWALKENIGMLLDPLNEYLSQYSKLLFGVAGMIEEEKDESAGLRVHIGKVTGLAAPTTAECLWTCRLKIQSPEGKAQGEIAVSQSPDLTTDPVWDEWHLVTPWRTGDSLELTVYRRRREDENRAGQPHLILGKVHVQSDLFDRGLQYPGVRPLGDDGRASLHFTVEAVKLEERTVDLTKPPDDSLCDSDDEEAARDKRRRRRHLRTGIKVEKPTRCVTEVDRGGFVADLATRQLPNDLDPLRPGDYISKVNGTACNPPQTAEFLDGKLDKLTSLSWLRPIPYALEGTVSMLTNVAKKVQPYAHRLQRGDWSAYLEAEHNEILGLLVTIRRATDLSGTLPPGSWCCSAAIRGKDPNDSGIGRKCVSLTRTMSPEWNSTLLLTEWKKGSSLMLSVFRKIPDNAAVGKRSSLGKTPPMQGQINITEARLSQALFDGELPLQADSDAKLSLRVEVVAVRETVVYLYNKRKRDKELARLQQKSKDARMATIGGDSEVDDRPMGLRLDSSTSKVLHIDPNGKVARWNKSRYIDFPMQVDDYLVKVNGEPGSVARLVRTMDMSLMESISYMRPRRLLNDEDQLEKPQGYSWKNTIRDALSPASSRSPSPSPQEASPVPTTTMLSSGSRRRGTSGGRIKTEPSTPSPVEMLGLLVFIRKASGLPEPRPEKPWSCRVALRGDSAHGDDPEARGRKSIASSRTCDPDFNATHLLAPYNDHGVKCVVYGTFKEDGREALTTKCVGAFQVQADRFDHEIFDGPLTLEGQEGGERGTLHVRLEIVSVVEITVRLPCAEGERKKSRGQPSSTCQGVEERYGIKVDAATLKVNAVDTEGLVHRSCAQDLLKERCMAKGDFLSKVNGKGGQADDLLERLNKEMVREISFRRVQARMKESTVMALDALVSAGSERGSRSARKPGRQPSRKGVRRGGIQGPSTDFAPDVPTQGWR